jgi:hypothetical protein
MAMMEWLAGELLGHVGRLMISLLTIFSKALNP